MLMPLDSGDDFLWMRKGSGEWVLCGRSVLKVPFRRGGLPALNEGLVSCSIGIPRSSTVLGHLFLVPSYPSLMTASTSALKMVLGILTFASSGGVELCSKRVSPNFEGVPTRWLMIFSTDSAIDLGL